MKTSSQLLLALAACAVATTAAPIPYVDSSALIQRSEVAPPLADSSPQLIKRDAGAAAIKTDSNTGASPNPSGAAMTDSAAAIADASKPKAGDTAAQPADGKAADPKSTGPSSAQPGDEDDEYTDDKKDGSSASAASNSSAAANVSGGSNSTTAGADASGSANSTATADLSTPSNSTAPLDLSSASNSTATPDLSAPSNSTVMVDLSSPSNSSASGNSTAGSNSTDASGSKDMSTVDLSDQLADGKTPPTAGSSNSTDWESDLPVSSSSKASSDASAGASAGSTSTASPLVTQYMKAMPHQHTDDCGCDMMEGGTGSHTQHMDVKDNKDGSRVIVIMREDVSPSSMSKSQWHHLGWSGWSHGMDKPHVHVMHDASTHHSDSPMVMVPLSFLQMLQARVGWGSSSSSHDQSSSSDGTVFVM